MGARGSTLCCTGQRRPKGLREPPTNRSQPSRVYMDGAVKPSHLDPAHVGVLHQPPLQLLPRGAVRGGGQEVRVAVVAVGAAAAAAGGGPAVGPVEAEQHVVPVHQQHRLARAALRHTRERAPRCSSGHPSRRPSSLPFMTTGPDESPFKPSTKRNGSFGALDSRLTSPGRRWVLLGFATGMTAQALVPYCTSML